MTQLELTTAAITKLISEANAKLIQEIREVIKTKDEIIKTLEAEQKLVCCSICNSEVKTSKAVTPICAPGEREFFVFEFGPSHSSYCHDCVLIHMYPLWEEKNHTGDTSDDDY